MSGTRWLFISRDGKVFRTYEPKNKTYKPIKALADHEVLEVILFYETKERKPNKLLKAWFDRFKLNSAGGHIVTDEANDRALHNIIKYGFVTPEELAKRNEPLSIPIAPIIPSISEKEALYIYLKQKLPMLYKDAPRVIENRIKSLKQNHQKYIDMIRQAKKLK